MNATAKKRILVIDDNADIHDDFRKILEQPYDTVLTSTLDAMESSLFDEPVAEIQARPEFQIDSAMQGQEGLARAVEARQHGQPYCVAFVDMRMPPGWDGVRTSRELLKVEPELRLVICSAYCDQSELEIRKALGIQDGRLQFRTKPFDALDIINLAQEGSPEAPGEPSSR